MASVSATDAWVVGYGSTGGAFVIRWNGTAWNTVAPPPWWTGTIAAKTSPPGPPSGSQAQNAFSHGLELTSLSVRLS